MITCCSGECPKNGICPVVTCSNVGDPCGEGLPNCCPYLYCSSESGKCYNPNPPGPF